MRVYTTKAWEFQTFITVFCMYNKLRLHAEIKFKLVSK